MGNQSEECGDWEILTTLSGAAHARGGVVWPPAAAAARAEASANTLSRPSLLLRGRQPLHRAAAKLSSATSHFMPPKCALASKLTTSAPCVSLKPRIAAPRLAKHSS